MQTDVVVDDEFKTSQTDAFVWNLAELERQLRVADVHHHFDRNFGQSAALDFFNREVEQTVVDVACVAFSTGNGDLLVFHENFGSIATADYGRDTELTGNNGSVASTTAAVSNDSRGTLHHRFPVGIRHVGNEHIALLHAIHFSSAAHNAHGARTDLLSNSAALDEHLALGVQGVALLHIGVGLTALNRFRTSLKNVDLAVKTVLTPFDIHRTTVMLFDNAGELGKFHHVFVSNGKAAAIFVGHINCADRTTARTFRIEFHLDEFATERLADNRLLALFEHGLVHIKLIGVDGTLHNGFTKAVAGRHEHNLIKAAFGIKREHHASSTLVRTAHTLHAGGQGHFNMGKALVNSVADGTIVVERSKHFTHMMQHSVNANHIQNSFLLTGKGSIRQVFGGSRRTHCHGDFFLTVLEPFVEFTNFLFKFGRERSCLNPATNFCTGLGKFVHIINVKTFQTRCNAVFKASFLQEQTKRFSRRGKAVRHTNTSIGQLTEQFAQRSIFAAHTINVGHAQLAEGKYITALNHLILFFTRNIYDRAVCW